MTLFETILFIYMIGIFVNFCLFTPIYDNANSTEDEDSQAVDHAYNWILLIILLWPLSDTILLIILIIVSVIGIIDYSKELINKFKNKKYEKS